MYQFNINTDILDLFYCHIFDVSMLRGNESVSRVAL